MRRAQPHKNKYITIYLSSEGKRKLDTIRHAWGLSRGKAVERMLELVNRCNTAKETTHDYTDRI